MNLIHFISINYAYEQFKTVAEKKNIYVCVCLLCCSLYCPKTLKLPSGFKKDMMNIMSNKGKIVFYAVK